MADDNSTGHVWDEDLRELNNPLPRWWMVAVRADGRVRARLLSRSTRASAASPGSLGWTSSGEHEAEQAQGERRRWRRSTPRFAAQPAETLSARPAGDGDRRAPVHQQLRHLPRLRRARQQGLSRTSPTPTGCTAARPRRSRRRSPHGRHRHRCRRWPRRSAARSDVRNVANYVLSLSGSPHDSIAAQPGRTKFAACAACHGADGKGNPALGAPNLTDKVWLHGWGEDAIVDDRQPRQDQRDAGARRPPDARADPPARDATSGACRRPRDVAAQ